MNTLTLSSKKSSTFATIIRLIFGVFGLVYLSFGIWDFLATGTLTVENVINGLLGLLAILVAVLNKKAWDPANITLNDDFIRTEEQPSYIRTAYWSKIDTLTLTRFGIRIKYQSGTPERFRLPYLSGDEYDDLRNWLQKTSTENEIEFSEKAWWKLF